MTDRDAKIRDARAARDELAAALSAAGIQFPALDVVPFRRGTASAHALVDLGVCAPPVARALAATIRKGAGA
ncbi:hypothetical protein [Streptomyces sp. NBC_01465]|uniref:hypothetical protein n=1 Tax=Streptomyces sp. NBC_01465 TaxID=2903878 RepID=UPI002E314B28|nr:hypothetical protein [Streptomyces sp. NBC_01465]